MLIDVRWLGFLLHRRHRVHRQHPALTAGSH